MKKLLPTLRIAAVLLAQVFVHNVDAGCSTGQTEAVCPQVSPELVEMAQSYDASADTYTSTCCPPGKSAEDSTCQKVPYQTTFCDAGKVEIYREIEKSGTQTYRYLCCPQGDNDIPFHRTHSTLCRPTRCMSDADVGNEADLCDKGLEKRVMINETLVQFKEATRDQCNDAGGQANSPGTVALCCVPGTQDEYLTTLMGAEPQEFPYFARVGRGGCGGQIYNENWIITASHCVVNHEETRKVYDIATDGQEKWDDNVGQVMLNLQIRDASSVNTYNVTEVHVHPGSSYMKPKADKESEVNGVSINDIALLKLDRPIQFGENVKAIKIAEFGFDPQNYGDHGFLTGFGDTDTTLQPLHRLKTNMLLRSKEDVGFLLEYHKMLLFAGGILKGKRSPLFGQGDSGGPLLCRGEDGKAVLCGTVGFLSGVGGTKGCLKNLDQKSCSVGTFVDVGYYNEWIRTTTGETQDNAQLVDQPLFGSAVQDNEFPAHVHVKSSDGVICGGTLIDDDVVLTAAHCVADDNGELKSVQVTTGVMDLNAGGGKTIDAKATLLMENFGKVKRPLWGGAGRKKRMVSFVLESWQRELLTDTDIMKDPYYKNDVALIKLKEKTGIAPAKLATDPIDTGDMAMEVAYPSKSLGKLSNGELPLSKRQFKMLDRKECQRRMDRLGGLGYNVQVDNNVVCGVEHFSGGSMCDRELGGGVYCVGDDGQYSELCGVQIHRLCEFNIPNEFVDVSGINQWLKDQLNFLKSI